MTIEYYGLELETETDEWEDQFGENPCRVQVIQTIRILGDPKVWDDPKDWDDANSEDFGRWEDIQDEIHKEYTLEARR